MNHKTTGIALVTALIVVSLFALCLPDSEAVGEDTVLFDQGNGVTYWTEAGQGSYSDVLTIAVTSSGCELSTVGTISVDGIDGVRIGDTHTTWRVYEWVMSGWSDVTDTLDLSDRYAGGPIALGFYPEGVAPVETPEYRSSWTMVRGDSHNTGSQTVTVPSEDGFVSWAYNYGNPNYVNSAILVEGDSAYVVAGGGYTANAPSPTLYCYDRFTGEERWKFSYDRGSGYETATGTIVGDHIFIPASNGSVYRIPLEGPGPNGSDVISFDVPLDRDHELVGATRTTGPTSLVYDSGMIFFGSSNGYAYCVDLDLNLVWKTQIGGCAYFYAPTIHDGLVVLGAQDGVLYLMDMQTGSIEFTETVFSHQEGSGTNVRTYGGANTVVSVGDTLMLSFSDGKGMDTKRGGIAAYTLDTTGLVKVFSEEMGPVSGYLLPVVNDGFTGVYFMDHDGLCRASIDGNIESLKTGLGSFKAPLTLVNGNVLCIPQYDDWGNVYFMDLGGNVLREMEYPEEVRQFCMAPVTIVEGAFYLGTDGGAFSYQGIIPVSVSEGMGWGVIALIVILILVIGMLAYVVHLSRGAGMPFVPFVRSRLSAMSGFNNDRTSKTKKNKRRLAVVIIIGLIMGFLFFTVSLAFGPSGNYSIGETFSLLSSAIGKTFSGEPLTNDEIILFDSRCCRAVTAFAVGVGLSISGAIYQAIIRNPMVDPYIMGVSAGAGVAAVATIAFDFTLFGLLDNITLVTPIVAMVGGVIAFGCTMLLAEKSGGSSLNYVLAGVIIGLVFSAIQTLMLSMAGDKLQDSMSWLFGTFANTNWTEAILVFIPAIAMSIVPMVWAKEFNLVLLGEDQARQMGLDVRRFNRWMLILASILASVCVAFVGIIGFVGLVVPHLCRMILGGDHRLVLPASIVVGGALMMAADLFSKMVMVPLELPVGAITTVIGAPVFAYLLIKKGRMYDG